MQSAVRFMLIKPGEDPNRKVNEMLQKISGWEVVSVSHQYVPAGYVVALAFRSTGGGNPPLQEIDFHLPE